MNHPKEPNQEKKSGEEEQQKWFVKEDLQDLAKMGGTILKKTFVSGMDVIKEVKENLPKEATSLLAKGKEELIRGLTQEMAKNLVSFTVEKFFKVAREHRIEFSLRIRKNEDAPAKSKPQTNSRSVKKEENTTK